MKKIKIKNTVEKIKDNVVEGYSNSNGSVFIGDNIDNEIHSNSIVLGKHGKVIADGNVIIGRNPSEVGRSSDNIIIGTGNMLPPYGIRNTMIGQNLVGNGGQICFGKYNNPDTIIDSDNSIRFCIGNGTSENDRRNIFEIRKNGDIYIKYNGEDICLQTLLQTLLNNNNNNTPSTAD